MSETRLRLTEPLGTVGAISQGQVHVRPGEAVQLRQVELSHFPIDEQPAQLKYAVRSSIPLDTLTFLFSGQSRAPDSLPIVRPHTLPWGTTPYLLMID